jgi:hypothetical protein
MNRKCFLPTLILLSGLLLTEIGRAQEVLSTAGTSFIRPEYVVTFTLGEMVIETFADTAVILTQGFNQGYLTAVAIQEKPGLGFSLNCFPNPATELLNLEVKGAFPTNLSYSLFDVSGRLLTRGMVVDNINTISVHALAPASYYLIISQENIALKTFKIVKKQ